MTLTTGRPARDTLETGRREDCSLRLPDGRKLSFAEYGEAKGLPLFAFHGTPGSRFMFRLAHEPASMLGLRIIAPDRPGFGNSTYQGKRTLRNWAGDVAALANSLGIERFGVAGISGGGPYAAACAAMLPKRVIAAGLVSPMGPVHLPKEAANFDSAQGRVFRLLPQVSPILRAAFLFGRFMFLNAPSTMYRAIVARAAPEDQRTLARPHIRQNLLDGVAEGLRPGIRGAVEEMRIFGAPWDLPLAEIEAPVVLWQGTADRNVPVASSHYLARLVPNCEFILLGGAGHYWIFEHVEDVLVAILRNMTTGRPG